MRRIHFDMMQIGIIGCGWAGQRHHKALVGCAQADVLAIADKDRERLRKLEKEWKIQHAFDDYRKLLQLDDLDAVIIALPHNLHREATVRSAQMGLDILCEKPIATTLDDADAMIDSAEENKALLMIAESRRYESLITKIEALLRDGSVGIPVFAEQNWLHKFDKYGYKDRLWLNDPAQAGGGQWIVNGTHEISALRGWFKAAGAGDVEKIFAKEFRSPSFQTPEGIEATVNAFLTFARGQTAKVTMAVEVEHHNRLNGVRIYGTQGTLIATGKHPNIELYSNRATDPKIIRSKDDGPSSFDLQMEHFIECIKTNKKPITSGIQERNTLAVIVAGYQSMTTGQAVDVYMRQ